MRTFSLCASTSSGPGVVQWCVCGGGPLLHVRQGRCNPLPSSPPTHQHVQQELDAQGPVIHAQTGNERLDQHGARHHVFHGEEAKLQEALATEEVQLPALLQAQLFPRMSKERVILQSREDGLLEMQETGSAPLGGKGQPSPCSDYGSFQGHQPPGTWSSPAPQGQMEVVLAMSTGTQGLRR